ncbi:MAG TPA: efflux transporter outer membrane subunit, partial [Methylibium sp.]
DTLASPASSGASVYNLHTLQLTVSYTPDVFGGNRRQVETLQAQADSQRWEAEATYLALTSNVTAAAVQEASLRGQIQATRELIDIQTEILKRFQRQYQLGQVALADVTQQEAALAAVQATLPPLDKQLALQRDLIKALAGQLPSEHLDAEFTLDSLSLPAELPLTLPSTLVDHRPDVLAAEEQLHIASANIGVARAARLPSVQLGVNAYGSAAYSIPDLFKAGTIFWTLAGGVAQTVFDGGTLRHREAAAAAAYDQAAAQYRATVINAYQNVADALQAIQADAQALRAADYAQDAADRSLAIARRQLALGDVSPMFVMQAEQAALQARLSVVQARANRLSDSVALFQALGGGWWNRQESLTQAPQ